MAKPLSFYAVCPLGLETMLADELVAAGGKIYKTERGGVAFDSDMEAAMRACLTSRLASRILMRLGSSDYRDAEDSYNFACRTKWEN